MMLIRTILTVTTLCSVLYAPETSLRLLAQHLDELAKIVKVEPVVQLHPWIRGNAFKIRQKKSTTLPGSTLSLLRFDITKLSKAQSELVKSLCDKMDTVYSVNGMYQDMLLETHLDIPWPVRDGIDEGIARLLQRVRDSQDDSDRRKSLRAVVVLLLYQEFDKSGSWQKEFDDNVRSKLQYQGEKDQWLLVRQGLREAASRVEGSPYYNQPVS